MGDNLDSDLLYDDFQENDRKEFNNVNILFFLYSCVLSVNRRFLAQRLYALCN